MPYNKSMSGLYETIEKNFSEKESDIQETKKELKNWLVFKVGGRLFAIESMCVKEILRKNEVYPVPFVAPYIKGVLNFYGKPFAVMDFGIFLDAGETESSLFMILDNESDFAIQIDEVVDFYSENDVEEQIFTERAEKSYFLQVLTIGQESAPVLCVENIIKKVRDDIEKN